MKRPKSDFTYEFLDGNVLLIYDQDLGNRSVTNDIESVIKTISEIEQVDLNKYNIAYQDSIGTFDGVRINGSFVEIYSINGKSKEDAITYFSSNQKR